MYYKLPHLSPFPVSVLRSKRLKVATGTSARCRPDAMNEKFRNVDTQLHGTFYGKIT